LAGVSADYIKRLEQGRGRPSMPVLDALSRALRLSREEYEHFCALAGHAPAGDGCVPTHLGPGARRLLDRLDAGPVGVFTAAWTQLAANHSWAALFGDPSAALGRERNLAWCEFTGITHCIEDPADAERYRASLVADLRTAVARYPSDRELAELVAALRSASSAFDQAWSGAPVTAHGVHRAMIVHPQVGPLRLDLDILTIHGGDLRVALFTAKPGSADAERLALVDVLGLQDLAAAEPARR
jgi:transcriptional regulator with XRE-family HTH domain